MPSQAVRNSGMHPQDCFAAKSEELEDRHAEVLHNVDGTRLAVDPRFQAGGLEASRRFVKAWAASAVLRQLETGSLQTSKVVVTLALLKEFVTVRNCKA